MMKRTKTKILVIFVCLALLVCACGNTDVSPAPDTPPVSDETPAPDDVVIPQITPAPDYRVTYPLTVTDQAGRTVTIASCPNRIASSYYISTSLLLALDLKDHMVGIEAKADKRNIYRLAAPSIIDLPNLGTAKEFQTETCIAATPDVVFLPLKLKNVADTLDELGIPAIVVNPENAELLRECIDLVGKVTDRMERAEALNKTIASCLEETAGMVADQTPPTVYLAGNSSLLSTAGSQMYQNALVSNSGGINVAADLPDTYWANVSYEQILAWNPDFIVIAADAGYSVEDVLADENLALCTAVMNGNVVKLPGEIEAWDSPVPGSFLGSVYLASFLHPDKVSRDYYTSHVASFYETYYGFVPSN